MSIRTTVVLAVLNFAAVGGLILTIQGRIFDVGPSPYGATELVTVLLIVLGLLVWTALFVIWAAKAFRESASRLAVDDNAVVRGVVRRHS